MVADKSISDSFKRIEELRGNDFLSYFEFGALASLDIFLREEVEVILLEVGLGGRLDAVNIVDADVSIVTTVDLDHQAWLGDTIEKIAFEKAGIFRSGRPAVCGEVEPAQSLLDHIRNIEAIEIRNSTGFVAEVMGDSAFRFTGLCADGAQRTLTQLPLPSLPLTSVACALEATCWLFPAMDEGAIREGLANAQLAGRCQKVRTVNGQGEPITVMLDVAHNPQAARFLKERVTQLGEPKPLAVLGMLDDKDLGGVLEPLTGLFDHWYTGTVSYGPRARDSAELADSLVRLGETVTCFDTIAAALQNALEQAETGSTVVVLGSFHTVGESLTFLSEQA